MRLKRGIGPLGLPGQCGRVPFGRVHASYSSSTEEFGNCMFVMFHLERKTLLGTYDEGVEVCLGPFT
jgi:hypothetical protein